MNSKRLKWYLHRLAAMGPKEVAVRAVRTMRVRAVRRAIFRETMPIHLADALAGAHAMIGTRTVEGASLDLDDYYLAALTDRADETCRHVVRLFGRVADMGSEINWLRDYLHGADFPSLPAWEINYRVQDSAADVMPVWWLNRHQHLMPPAIAHFATGEAKYAQEVFAQLQSWLSQCAYPLGPAWISGIEAGVRLLTWSWLYRFLFAHGKPPGGTDSLLVAWFQSVCKHVKFITTNWSHGSSANNHVIAEAVGVLAAATTWPSLFPGKKHVEHCRRILSRECRRQISPEGVCLEQSTSYHSFVLELLVNACLLDDAVQKEQAPCLRSMAHFLHALACNATTAPQFGDGDDAIATGILERSPQYCHEVIAAACAVADPDNTAPPENISSPVFWYAGYNLQEAPVPPADEFAGSAYTVWNGVAAPDLSAKLCVDTGPLGLGSLAAHGHADALSFTLHLDGEPVLIDPGTYAYHAEQVWRDYFRGTRAHNTLRVARRDQAVMRGPFLWGRRYKVTVDHAIMSDDQFDLLASHDGYRRSARVIHRRRISWHPLRRRWIIEDELVGKGEHEVELLYHVHPRRTVRQVRPTQYRIRTPACFLALKMPSQLESRIACGETDPPLGWWSPVLGVKEPCITISGTGRIKAGEKIITELAIQADETT